MSEGRKTPIPAGLIARVVNGARYVVTGATDWFGPLQPIAPMAPPEVTGRRMDYEPGYNIVTQPRREEAISFHQLRGLADAYDVLRLCIETRKDQVEKYPWMIQPRDDSLASDHGNSRIKRITDMMQRPDGRTPWATWMRILLEELFVIDAPTIYYRRNKGGDLYGLEVIDGSTIKPVLNGNGRTPVPPDVAYQQVLKGLPAVDYTTDQLLYYPRNQRAPKVYGYSPVEQIIATVNMALRNQTLQLSYLTEGNDPEGLVSTPKEWSVDQIRKFQTHWNNLMNAVERRRIRFVPGDMKYQALRQPELKGEFDEWLARIVCYAFSLPPTPFIRQMNRATAETSQNASLEEGLAPLLLYLKNMMDTILVTAFNAPDLEFIFKMEKEVDPQQQAEVNDV